MMKLMMDGCACSGMIGFRHQLYVRGACDGGRNSGLGWAGGAGPLERHKAVCSCPCCRGICLAPSAGAATLAVHTLCVVVWCLPPGGAAGRTSHGWGA